MGFIKYTNTLTSCLMTYQYIEESLKQCLVRVHAIIAMRTSEYIPYDIPFDSIDNSALGSLIEQYKGFTKDKELITNLRQLKKHRNECAHRGYLLNSDEQNDIEFLETKISEIAEFDRQAQECFSLLGAEIAKLEKIANKVASIKKRVTSNNA